MREIERRTLGRTGLRPTVIGFGALEIGRDWGVGDAARRKRPLEGEAADTLRRVLDSGINLIDTASAYHRSEERVGRFTRGRRTEFILATKCGEHNREPDTFYDFSYEAVRRSIAGSLRLLETPVIDILQIHFGPDPNAVLDDGGCVRAMKEAKAAGAVRFLGASVDGPVLDRCIDSGDFDVVQVGYSLLRPGEQERIARAHGRNIGVLVRSGFAGGWLTPAALRVPEAERPPAVNALLEMCGGDAELLFAVALHFVVRNPGVSSLLVGSKSFANIGRAIEVLENPPAGALMEKALRLQVGG